jgi:L-iditol 2-dehydrogenase
MHGANGDFKIIDPLVLGHEAGGVITALGPEPASPTSRNAEGQARFKVGDRVAIECGHACGGCRMCKEGRYNLCKVRTSHLARQFVLNLGLIAKRTPGRLQHMRFCSSAKTHPHLDGTLQDEMNHPVNLLHK